MWDDVIIGSGRKGNSATRVFAIEGEHSIAENGGSYWIDGLYLGLGMTVFKNTDEGAQLTQLIDAKAGLEPINQYLTDLLLKNISIERLKAAIENAVERAYCDGSDAKAAEMRRVLGL